MKTNVAAGITIVVVLLVALGLWLKKRKDNKCQACGGKRKCNCGKCSDCQKAQFGIPDGEAVRVQLYDGGVYNAYKLNKPY